VNAPLIARVMTGFGGELASSVTTGRPAFAFEDSSRRDRVVLFGPLHDAAPPADAASTTRTARRTLSERARCQVCQVVGRLRHITQRMRRSTIATEAKLSSP
jgi:hypothetical protein